MDLSFVHTTNAKLNSVTKKHGQIIFVTDEVAENNSILADFLDTTTNVVERHLLTTLPSLSMNVDLTNGHLMYQYSMSSSALPIVGI